MSEVGVNVLSEKTQTTAKVRKTNIKKMSADELRALLAEKEAKERANKEFLIKKMTWKDKKDDWVKAKLLVVCGLQEQLRRFKEEVMAECEAIYNEYFIQIAGNVAENKPALYSLTTENGQFRVEFDASEKYKLDDTAMAAVAKIQGFISSKFKGKEEYKALYSMINAILTRNKAGEYNPTLVTKLVKIKNEGVITDEEFVQGVEMLEAAQISAGKASYIRFYERNEKGVEEPITLQFSAL